MVTVDNERTTPHKSPSFYAARAFYTIRAIFFYRGEYRNLELHTRGVPVIGYAKETAMIVVQSDFVCSCNDFCSIVYFYHAVEMMSTFL